MTSLPRSIDASPTRRIAAYVAAAAAPSALSALVYAIASWPKPYSWQYLGVSLAVAITLGIGPGLVALGVATLAVLWLGVPTPVHPGVEMFVAIDLCLLALLHRTRHMRQLATEGTARLAGIIESSDDAIVSKDMNGIIRTWNPGAERLLGYSAEEIVGKPVTILLPADRIDEEEGILRRLRDGQRVEHVETARLAKDGRRVDVSVTSSPIKDAEGNVIGASKIMRDITERRRAEQALRESEATIKRERAFLRTVIDCTPGLIMVRDAEGRCLLVNEAAARFHGMNVQSLEGRLAGEIPTILPAALEQDQEVLRSGKEMVSDEFEGVGADGVVHSFLNVKTPLPNRDGILDRVLTTSVDITWRKRAEATVRAANAQLADADRRKDEFIAVLSHELRNPLAPIRYALPLLHREELSAAAAHAVTVIGRQTDHLTRLVDDLLDVSRITRGRMELRREPVALGTILAAAAEAASPEIGAARHQLHVRAPDEVIWLHADPARLAQVVTNLLNNSAKYTPRGGQITLDARQDGGDAVIRVRDNGMGIPADALPTVFEMFRQVDRPDKSQGGLGIGLALVRRLVQMHGGSVEAHSAGAGQGAEFVVRLPIAETPKAQPAETTSRPAACGKRLKVLIVDDNVDLVEMLAMVVAGLGHEVRRAFDGRSALGAARSFRPDVILLDLGLPLMSGIEVAAELRREPATATARLVALTGWGQAEDRQRTRQAGFDDHLTKPTEPDMLEKLLGEIAQQRC